MANPMFGMPDVSDPQQMAADTLAQQQQQALQYGMVQPPSATPGSVPMGGAGGTQAVAGYMNPYQIAQMYGSMAGSAENPQQMLQNYVSAIQRQQQLDYQQSPQARWLQLYGKINPFDFTADSIADFHRTLTGSGDFAAAMEKLVRKETLSSTEQGIIDKATEDYYKADTELSEMTALSQQFDQMARTGAYRGGVQGQFEGWIRRLTGFEGDIDLLKTRYAKFVNSAVVGDLPPGVASDTDIRIAREGWPGKDASPAYIAAYLRGMMKLRAIAAAQAEHKAFYLSDKQTQTGLVGDWQKQRQANIMRIMQQHGGIHNPTDAQGNSLSLEDAANSRYQYGTQTTADTGGGAPAPPELLARPPEDEAYTKDDVKSALDLYK